MNIKFSEVTTSATASEQIAINHESSWLKLANRFAVLKPPVGHKNGPYLLRGPCNGQRSDANMTEAYLVIIDGDSTVGEEGEKSAPPVAQAIAALNKLGLNYVLHTSHSHQQQDKGNRYRIIIPLSRACSKAELSAINHAVHKAVQDEGCPVAETGESGIFSQPWYLPRIASADADYECHIQTAGHAFALSAAVAPPPPSKVAEYVPHIPTNSPIDTFNRQHKPADILTRHGYKLKHTNRRTGEVRLLSPDSKSGSAGVIIYPDGHFHSFGDSDAFADGGKHDAFDAFTVLECGGDRDAALQKIMPCSAASPIVPWSDPEPLPKALLPVLAFDTSLLPKAFKAYADEASEVMQCPIEYIAVALMAALGGVVGKSCIIHPKALSSWAVAPNLWAALIGRPSMMKSPAMTSAMSGVSALIAEARKVYSDALEHFEIQQKVHKAKDKLLDTEIAKLVKDGKPTDSVSVAEKPTPPVEKRIVTNAGSVERLIALLEQNPNGIIQHRDELAGWLRSMENTASQDARSFYIESWNGNASSFSYDTVTHGHLFLETGPCVTVMGTIQPGPLSTILAGVNTGGVGDDGLLQRFQLMVMPDKCENWQYVDRPTNQMLTGLMHDVFKNVSELSGELRFAEDAQPIFVEWYTDITKRAQSETSPAMESHLSKYGQLMPSLALLIHLADYIALPDYDQAVLPPVSADAAHKAAAWCTWLESHARRIYALGAHVGVETARKVIRSVIDEHLPNPFKPRNLQRKGWVGLSSKKQVREALDLMELYGWMQRKIVKTGGRDSEFCHIHPQAEKYMKMGITPTDKTDKSPLVSSVSTPQTHFQKINEVSFI